MDREFLEDYEAKEKETLVKHGIKYSLENRLKLKKPYAWPAQENIWHQIPFYGTILIPLVSCEDSAFFEVHGFHIEEIDKVIDLAKETDRIQFILISPPTDYEGMDYLDSVFKEMDPPWKPPIRLHDTLYNQMKEDIKLWYDEMSYLISNPNFAHQINDLFSGVRMRPLTPIDEEFPHNLFDSKAEGFLYSFIDTCIDLRVLGCHNIADEIALQMSINPLKAFIIFYISDKLITRPFSDPLKAIHCLDNHILKELNIPLNHLQNQAIEFPCEVGKFLTKKLTPIPKDYEACIDLIYTYEENDLNKVLNALNEAVKKEKIDMVKEKSEEISIIFENVWSDVDKLKRKINIAKHGISLGIGVIGAVATMPIGGLGGLVAGLGFEVAEKIGEEKKVYEPVSEKILRGVASSHMIHIYDFKKKYKL
jgi:hypothetical protein